MRARGYFLVFILFSTCQLVSEKSTNFDRNRILTLRLIDQKLVVSPADEWVPIRLSIQNNSDSALILYDFFVVNPGNSLVEDFEQPMLVGGNAAFVFNNKGDFVPIFRVQPLSGTNQPTYGIDSATYVGNIIESHGRRMVASKLILRPKEVWTGSLNAMIETRSYSEGTYKLFLIFACGKNITNVIASDKIREDERLNGAFVFQGYTRSNAIELNLTKEQH